LQYPLTGQSLYSSPLFSPVQTDKEGKTLGWKILLEFADIQGASLPGNRDEK
jgi:hypothetical protein